MLKILFLLYFYEFHQEKLKLLINLKILLFLSKRSKKNNIIWVERACVFIQFLMVFPQFKLAILWDTYTSYQLYLFVNKSFITFINNSTKSYPINEIIMQKHTSSVS